MITVFDVVWVVSCGAFLICILLRSNVAYVFGVVLGICLMLLPFVSDHGSLHARAATLIIGGIVVSLSLLQMHRWIKNA